MSNCSEPVIHISANLLEKQSLPARLMAGVAGENAELGRQIEALGARLVDGDALPDRLTLAMEMQAFDRLSQCAHALAAVQAHLARCLLSCEAHGVDDMQAMISRIPLPDVRDRMLRIIGIQAVPRQREEADDTFWEEAAS